MISRQMGSGVMIPFRAEMSSMTASNVSGERQEPYSPRRRSFAIPSKLRKFASDSPTGNSGNESRMERGRRVDAVLNAHLSKRNHIQQIRKHLVSLIDNKRMRQVRPCIPVIFGKNPSIVLTTYPLIKYSQG
ncbi:hypothetical protein B0J17DRAFT_16342 [Rhizoctonia solani]|nr:hypothetical protein B0J17DRAFT_16342 [Rhizoctonia solani]